MCLGREVTTPWGSPICCGYEKGRLTSLLLVGTLHFCFTLDSADFVFCPGCVGQWQKKVDRLFQLIIHSPGSWVFSCPVRGGIRHSIVLSQRVQTRDQVRNQPCCHKLFGRDSSPLFVGPAGHGLDSCQLWSDSQGLGYIDTITHKSFLKHTTTHK